MIFGDYIEILCFENGILKFWSIIRPNYKVSRKTKDLREFKDYIFI